MGISHVPYVQINDRSLRVTERLSRASLSPVRFLSLSLLPSLEVESAKPSRRNLRYPIDFPAGMLQHCGRRERAWHPTVQLKVSLSLSLRNITSLTFSHTSVFSCSCQETTITKGGEREKLHSFSLFCSLSLSLLQ